MKHWVMNLIGSIAGLAVGSVVVPSAILAGFTSTHVSWDASQCPAGNYTVTTTATNKLSGQIFQTASSTFPLPAATIGQDFSDLPPGTYVVTARATATDGESFKSVTQTLTVAGSAPAPGSPDPLVTETGGRKRPTAARATGAAQPRIGFDGSNQIGGSARRASELVGVDASSQGGTSTTALARIETQVSLAWALETIARLADGHRGGSGPASQIDVVDEDGDGAIDYVRFRIGTALRVLRVSGGDR